MRVFLLLVGFLVSFSAAAAATYPPVSVKVKAVRVGTHSFYLPGLAGAASRKNAGFMSNAGFVVTSEGVVVFDALGTPSLAAEMMKQIRGVTQAPIKRVIVSHYHADHYYGLQVFKDEGAEIWAHEAARNVFALPETQARFEQRKQALKPWVSDKVQRFVEPDLWLKGDSEFELGGLRFKLRHVGPAHSAEDMALYVEDDGVLYAGDLVFKGRVPFVGDADSRLWLKALDKLIALKPRVLVPGHGEVSTEPLADLALTRDYLAYLREQMGRAVAELIPFEDAYFATDWSRYQFLPAFTEANRRNAYNTYILMEKEALAK